MKKFFAWVVFLSAGVVFIIGMAAIAGWDVIPGAVAVVACIASAVKPIMDAL